MASVKFFEKLSSYQKELSSRIFDLVLSRVLSQAYLAFDEEIKEEMKRVFSAEGGPASGWDSDNNKEKDNFIKKNIPDFKKFFETEIKKIEADIKTEIEKKI